jgi:hypothetical protein
MTAVEAFDRSIGAPFVSDPLEVARSYWSLCRSQRQLAIQYTRWAQEAVTEAERIKWAGEAAHRWDGARFGLRKYREYVETAIG